MKATLHPSDASPFFMLSSPAEVRGLYESYILEYNHSDSTAHRQGQHRPTPSMCFQKQQVSTTER